LSKFDEYDFGMNRSRRLFLI